MKHTIEIKLPKLFGKKVNEDVVREEEVVETDDVKIQQTIKLATMGVAVITISYLVGYNKGMSTVSKAGNFLYVIK